MTGLYFTTESGFPVPGVSATSYDRMLEQLHHSIGVTPAQLVEAASYSLAMVVRFALGLSANEGQVCAVVNQSLSSAVTLACIRHLLNGGGEAVVLLLGSEEEHRNNAHPAVTHELQILGQMGIRSEYWNSADQSDGVVGVLQACHNCICGLYSGNSEQSSFEANSIELLNELSTPVHTVSAPLGIDVDSGTRRGTPLFASSTLSLGVPYAGLATAADYVGRLYVCDVSFTAEIYRSQELELGSLFSEQPVVRLVPPKESSEVMSEGD